MDMESLQTFLEVERGKSFTHAAETLFCTQAAISMRIKRLEEDMNCVLFTRRSRSMELTRDGQLFLPYAHQMYNIWVSSRERLNQNRLMEQSELNIACAGSLGSYIVPSLIYYFKQKYPYVLITNNLQYTQNVVSAVAKGQVSFGVIAHTANIKASERFICEPLIEDPLIIVAHPDHPWSLREGVYLRELTQVKLLLSGTGITLVDLLERIGGFKLDISRVSTFGNIEAVKKNILQNGEQVTVMSEYAVRPELELGLLKRVPILDRTQPSRFIYSIRNRNEVQPPISKLFLEFAAESALNGVFATWSM